MAPRRTRSHRAFTRLRAAAHDRLPSLAGLATIGLATVGGLASAIFVMLPSPRVFDPG